VVISNRVFNSNTNFIRNLEKLGTGNLTMYGVNTYNGSTIVSRGTLSIPTGGSLINCSNTVVGNTSEVASTNSASLNLAGAAGVVQVSTNGFVRGYTSESTTTLGTITSLQVQEAGTVEVALGSTWTTGGTIDFATGSKVSVTGTPVTGQSYTLITAGSPITGTPTLATSIAEYQLTVSGNNLLLSPVVAAPSGLSYSLSSLTATVGTPILSLNPAVTGVVTTYSVTPSLPSGLSINSLTGVIGGTPSVPATTATYTITASNSLGSTSTTLSLTVTPSGASFDLAYPGRGFTEVAPNGATYGFNYSFGGDSSNIPSLPYLETSDPNSLALVAVVRTNDPSLSVTGETVGNLSDFTNPSSIDLVTGSASNVSQEGVPSGCERRRFLVNRGTDNKKFLRLKVTQK
jgi:autotransporter-associated beta strand protein